MKLEVVALSGENQSDGYLELYIPELEEDVTIFFLGTKNYKTICVPHKSYQLDAGRKLCVSLADLVTHIETFGRFDLAIETQNTCDRISYVASIAQKEKVQLLPVADSDEAVGVYINDRNGLSVIYQSINRVGQELFHLRAFLKSIKVSKNGILKMKINTVGRKKFQVINSLFKLRGDKTAQPYILLMQQCHYQKEASTITFQCDLTKMDWQQFYWDAYVIICVDGHFYEIRVKNQRVFNTLKLQYFQGKNEYSFSNSYFIYPYITLDNSLSLNYRKKSEYDSFKYIMNGYLAFLWYFFGGFLLKMKKVWLVHEKFSMTAQDNSFYFFKYCFNHHPEKNVYYVIDPESDDLANLQGMEKKTIKFMSIRHQFYIFISEMIISSESKGHGYAWRINKGMTKLKLNKKKYIFLQHGVIGFKKLDNTFKANGVNHADRFVVSSELEKEVVKENLNYTENELIITGLARWDNIRNIKSNSEKKHLLYMPTWRTWLDECEEDVFLNSDYYQNISFLLQSTELKEFLEQEEKELLFYLHPKFFEKASSFNNFTNQNIRFIPFGKMPLGTILTESSVLITDYSSIAWDSIYQDIPVIFYQFDRDRYLTEQGAYIDFEEHAFGEIVENHFDLFNALDRVRKNNYLVEEKFIKRKKEYFKYLDHQNSERIYKKVIQFEQSLSTVQIIIHELKRSPIIRTQWFKMKNKRNSRDDKHGI